MIKIYAKGTSTNVREMPNTQSKVLETITQTKGLEYILTTPPHNGKKWYAVRTGSNKTGYVRSDVAIQTPRSVKPPEEKYRDVVIEGSEFPDSPYTDEAKISLSSEIIKEYLPTLEKTLPKQPRGLKLLLTIMANKEGYYKGSRSYRTNNPGNIGNTDSGSNTQIKSLIDGILRQRDYITRIIEGKNKSYPMNKDVFIKPYYSPEIGKNQKNYGMSPWLPGYRFKFTGQLDQFVKIYSTGARAGNSYLNQIVSYFKNNGIKITPQSKIQDIIKMN